MFFLAKIFLKASTVVDSETSKSPRAFFLRFSTVKDTMIGCRRREREGRGEIKKRTFFFYFL